MYRASVAKQSVSLKAHILRTEGKDQKPNNPRSPLLVCDKLPSDRATRRNLLERDLLALEATATATATSETATTTTAATSTATTATATETTTTATVSAEAATAATTTTTAEATATAAAVAVTRLSVVKTDGASIDILSVKLLESLLGVLNGAEGDVTETLGAARLPVGIASVSTSRVRRVRQGKNILVGRETEGLNSGSRVEELGDEILSGGPGQVADEKGVARRADLITILLLTSSSAVLGLVLGLLGGEVESHVTAIEEGTLLGIKSLLSSLGIAEVDVTETARAARLTVGDDASTNEILELLELLEEGVVVDVPSEVTNEEGGALLRIDLGLLALSILLLGIVLSLALLGRLLGLGLLGLLRVRVGRVRVRAILLIIVGVVRRVAGLVARLLALCPCTSGSR